MDFRVAAAGRGVAWFQGAVRMLDRKPLGLVQVACGYVLIQMLPNMLVRMQAVSVVLSVVVMLLWPALLAGLLHAVAEADAGRPVSSALLFEGLRRRGVRAQLLMLGVFALVAGLLMALSIQRIVSPEVMTTLTQLAAQKITPDSPAAKAAAVPMLKAMMAVLAIAFVLLTGMFFAVPRVMFDGRGAVAAVLESFAACAANVLSLVVYGLLLIVASFALGLVLLIVAAILGLLGGIGAMLFVAVVVATCVIVLLVSTTGNYLAWRDVFGRDDANVSSPPPQAGIIV